MAYTHLELLLVIYIVEKTKKKIHVKILYSKFSNALPQVVTNIICSQHIKKENTLLTS